jgi:hypothetical protein
LLARLIAPNGITIERALVFTINAIDWNCSKYNPRLGAETA